MVHVRILDPCTSRHSRSGISSKSSGAIGAAPAPPAGGDPAVSTSKIHRDLNGRSSAASSAGERRKILAPHWVSYTAAGARSKRGSRRPARDSGERPVAPSDSRGVEPGTRGGRGWTPRPSSSTSAPAHGSAWRDRRRRIPRRRRRAPGPAAGRRGRPRPSRRSAPGGGPRWTPEAASFMRSRTSKVPSVEPSSTKRSVRSGRAAAKRRKSPAGSLGASLKQGMIR